jgi:hypothetical protein
LQAGAGRHPLALAGQPLFVSSLCASATFLQIL